MKDKVLFVRVTPQLHTRVTTETTRRLRYGQPRALADVARQLLVERLDQLDAERTKVAEVTRDAGRSLARIKRERNRRGKAVRK